MNCLFTSILLFIIFILLIHNTFTNILLCIILLIILLSFVYNIIIHKYLTCNKNTISYDILLKHFIMNVSSNNYYMNYGLWDDENNTLIKANNNLIQFVFDKTTLLNKKKMNILDVGCGYGHQDIEWSKKLDKSCKIKAIDISETQIYHAMKEKSDVIFDICDAMFIDLKYKNELFDVIISLESAFHYPDRGGFFKNVNKLLKPDGKFVITDIMLQNSCNSSIMNNLFVKIFSDCLHIPKQNLITGDEWEKQILGELNIIETHDITEKTFKPYYKHFISNYAKNHNLPECVSDYLVSFFCNVQPFAYKVAVCTKKE